MPCGLHAGLCHAFYLTRNVPITADRTLKFCILRSFLHFAIWKINKT